MYEEKANTVRGWDRSEVFGRLPLPAERHLKELFSSPIESRPLLLFKLHANVIGIGIPTNLITRITYMIIHFYVLPISGIR